MSPDSPAARRKRIVFGVTVASTARAFLRGQLGHFASRGWDVHLVCGEAGLEGFAETERVSGLHFVPATREPSLMDPVTLLRLWWRMLKTRPSVVVMGTPKVGVLGTVAATLARVPVRIYVMHGYRAEGLSGLKRWIVHSLDRLACSAATHVIAVSPSLMRRLVAQKVVSESRIRVMGRGSANGLDMERFRPPTGDQINEARRALDLPADGRVIACVGRLTGDKGLRELPLLWKSVVARHPAALLVVAGTPEPSNENDVESLRLLSRLPGVRILGQMSSVERIYQLSDLLLLLSKREGLGMVALEAAACGVPTVGFAATGVVDAVAHGRTGILTEPGDLNAVVDALSLLLEDEPLRLRMGEASREYASAFRQEAVWNIWERWLGLLLPDVGSPGKLRRRLRSDRT